MRTADFLLLKTAIRQILMKSSEYEWSVQGFGMLRLYMGKQTRLHVWSKEVRVADVSDIHDHPWDFRSVIIAGQMMNTRFIKGAEGETYFTQQILCGAGGYPTGGIQQVKMWASPSEVYNEGEEYHQSASEIHQSIPNEGAVTLITRHFLPDTDHANIFWQPGKQWVSAEPRKATSADVRAITTYALERWF